MKFKDMKRVKDEYSFEFVENGIMVGSKGNKCLTCGETTEFIEVCSEAYFCSHECVKEFDKEVDQLFDNYIESE